MDTSARTAAIASEFSHAAGKLELADVLELIAARAVSDRGAERLRDLEVLSTLEEVERSQALVAEALEGRLASEPLPLPGWRDSAGALAKIKAEGLLSDPEDLVTIAEAEAKAAEMRTFLEHSSQRYPLLSAYAKRFEIQDGLIKKVRHAIGPDFEVLDRASPQLGRLRRQTAGMRERLRKQCADFASQHARGRGEEFVTMRGERYVIALPRGEASGVKGIVHQASGSGASLFIEPLEFVDENNRIESAIREEQEEIARILGELTTEVFRAKEALEGNQAVLLEIDALQAKASFAQAFRCIRPAHSDDGTLEIKKARHPLLEKRFAEEGQGRAVTGLDLICEPALRVLVISGPNAGGKTVALKTAGLVALMDRCGLLIPCAEGTALPDHESVFVDIGDDQSIEQSLSTFSSRVLRMKKILALAGERSLVLVDEIGDGTDPEEGAALAVALLEQLGRQAGRTIVTTHMSFLKGWAHETQGAGNATLEFDPDGLTPLFRMRMGVPGRSWGIETAGRMGLPEAILDEARRNLGHSALRLEELLAHLERTEALLGREREQLLRREEELGRLVSSYRERLDTFEAKKEELQHQARTEALDIVTDTRKEMERLVKEIRTAQAERAVISKSKEAIRRRAEEFEKKVKKPKRPKEPVDPEAVEPGLWVQVTSLGKAGKVIERLGKDRVRVELPGGLRVETRMSDLARTEQRPDTQKRPQVTYRTGYEGGPVETELMIRGMERAEAMEAIDAFIDRAVVLELSEVSIIHGIGRGILKRLVYDMLKDDPRVVDVHPGIPALGGDGVAIVKLR